MNGDCYITGLVGTNPVFDTLALASNYINLFIAKLKIDQVIDVGDNSGASPNNFILYQNYPSLFNPATDISFKVAKDEFVSLKIYDVFGNEIKTLASEEKEPGEYKIVFDATALSSGVYFYQLKTESFVQTKKMILMR